MTKKGKTRKETDVLHTPNLGITTGFLAHFLSEVQTPALLLKTHLLSYVS